MGSKVYLLVSTGEVWTSHRQVRKSLTDCYLSLRGEGRPIKKLAVPPEGLGKKIWMKLTKESWESSSLIHIVVVDGGVPLSDLGLWAKWMNPQTTRFHIHAWSDLIIRMDEWRDTLHELNGFSGSIRVCSEAMKNFFEKIFGKAHYVVTPLPIHDSFFSSNISKRATIQNFSYIGRINVDKGINELITWWMSRSVSNETLSFFGKPSYEENVSWYSDFKKRQDDIEGKLRPSNISCKYLKSRGSLQNKLKKTDLIISASTFMCEEFGLAIGEALASGKIVALSKWGGHAEFKHAPGVVYLPLKDQFPPSVDVERIQKSIRKFKQSDKSKLEQGNKKWALKHLTQKVISRKLNSQWSQSSPLPEMKLLKDSPLHILWKSFSDRRIFLK